VPPVAPPAYVLPAASKNLSYIYSQVPPNIVPGFTLLTLKYIEPTGYIAKASDMPLSILSPVCLD
jgi:hypothetical protein